MSDESEVAAEAEVMDADDAQDSIFDQPNGNDWFLAQLVEFANKYGIEIGVTLTVGGSTISGMLISGRTFFEEVEKGMAGANTTTNPDVDAADLAQSLAALVGRYREVYPPTGDSAWGDGPPKPGFVHLRGARFFAPGAKGMPVEGMLWRGKMSAVDGVSLGNLS